MHESAPLLATLRLIKPGLSPALTQLADFIEDHLSSISRMTVTELAEEAAVSVSSVSRLSRELGYRSYVDFKMAAHSSISVPTASKGANHCVLDEAEKFFGLTKELLNELNLDELGAYLRRSECLFVAGDDAFLVQSFVDACLQQGKRAIPLTQAAYFQTMLSKLSHKDIFVYIGSETPSGVWLEILEALAEKDCVTLAISPILSEPARNTHLDFWVPIICEGSVIFNKINILLTIEILSKQFSHGSIVS